jgi:hypothetical protein
MITADFVVCKALIFRTVGVFEAKKIPVFVRLTKIYSFCPLKE